ncbi:MAG TPA: UDP-N-acetylmuramate dehydrogenase [Actinomycetota bacterium]|nr:UDP-N-acetylmuramate dehydrogenase [Actinomycetota bacterium]
MFPRLATALSSTVRGRVEQEVPLGQFTTYRLGGPAAIYVEPADIEDLYALAHVLREEGASVPVLSLGRGSNTVVSDSGWPGVALRLPKHTFSWTRPAGEDAVSAGAATSLPVVANWAAYRDLAGIEFFVAIPGSVGGAVRMNAGAHGGEVAGVLGTALIFDLDNARVEERSAEALGFSYRHSNLAAHHLVIEAVFRLGADAPGAVKRRMEEFRRHRAATQPPAVQNAGSTFKNPPGDHAGRLVEAAGLKGLRVGGVSVSEKHANFFVSESDATAQDVYDLVHEVRRRVEDRFGVILEPEVRFAGRFEGSGVGSK